MRFKVGPWKYRVRVTADPIFLDGAERLGLCREKEQDILISPKCPVKKRLAIVFHELTHAWIFHTGQPRLPEEVCDFVATLASAAFTDLAISGGDEALMRLDPGESPQPMAARICLTNSRYCSECCSTIAGGSVMCVPSSKPDVLKLSLYCPHCDHVQTWFETVTGTGFPSGTNTGKPKHERGAAVQEFLASNPFACPDYVAA